ncbi:glycosyltransferase [Flavobacteriaceae bacterium]|nr:glycosyltransferase [Flavobacteriaceae bacterium]
MKIIHLNYNDSIGGAAKASSRIHKELLTFGIDSKFLTIDKYTQDIAVYAPINWLEKSMCIIIRKFNKLFLFLFYRNRKNAKFSVNLISIFSRLSINSMIKDSDLLNLYWVEDSLINFQILKKIKKPIIWRLSDLAPMTGGCHFSNGCNKYVIACGKCPILDSNQKYDLAFLQFYLKKKIIDELDITIVAPSSWIAAEAAKSFLFKNKKIKTIYTGVDTNIFFPYDKINARKHFNLDSSKKILLFGAMSAVSDPRKGYNLLINSLNKLNFKDEEIELIIFGSKNLPALNKSFKIHMLGNISDEYELRLAYNCADLFLCPSREDNLPNTVLEAMACSVPVIAFDIGGLGDAVRHKKNGYLANKYDCFDFANGIKWGLDELNNSGELKTNAINLIKSEFNIKKQTSKFIKLFEEIINDRKK